MTKDQLTTNYHLEEVKATLPRVFKIWWSVAWRGCLILAILGGLFLGAAELFENTYYQSFIAWMDEPITKNGVGIFVITLIVPIVFVLCYLFICLILKLIIGIQYKDFRLDFTPMASPGWRKICRVSLRYITIMASIGIVSGALETLSLRLPFGEIISLGLATISGLLQIYAISFIVNRSYGNARLSLIKRDMLEKT